MGAFVNVWVPLAAVQRDPLGMIEWQSQAPRDVRTVRYIYKHRQGEIYHCLPSEQHRWIYYPSMEPGECLVFKVFDSCKEEGTARFSLHASFEDKTAPETAPSRESVELRCAVFFGDLPPGFASSFVAPHLDPDSADQDLSPDQTIVLPISDEW